MRWLFKRGIVDDRGNQLPALNTSILKRTEEGSDTRSLLAKRIEVATKGMERRSWTASLVGLGVFAVTRAIIALIESSFPIQHPSGLFLGFIVSLVCGVVAARYVAKRMLQQKITATAVAEGFCGSCGYSLRSLEVQHDRCVACAECGAAWQSARIVQPFWASPRDPHQDDVSFTKRRLFLVPRKSSLMIWDDRGRLLRAMDSRLRLMTPDVRSQMHPDEIARVRHAARRLGRPVRLLVVAACWLVPMTFLFRAWDGGRIYFEVVRSMGLFIAVLLAVLLVVSFFILAGGLGASAARVARAIVREGYCGACATSLQSQTPDHAGLSNCKKCGASWRVSGLTNNG